MRRFPLTLLLLGFACALTAGQAFAQSIQLPASLPLAATATTATGAGEGAAVGGQFRPRPVSDSLPHLGVGLKLSTLGIGFQVGTAVASRVNIRGGANFLNWNDSVNENGVTYNGTLRLRSVEAKVDLFVAGGFRVTPGFLLYNDNGFSATALVPGGQSFTLSGTRYFSSATNPITGTAALTLNKTAPTLAIGFGNLLPRSGRHFSVSTDIGVVFQGSPQFALGLAGNSCAPTFTACVPLISIP